MPGQAAREPSGNRVLPEASPAPASALAPSPRWAPGPVWLCTLSPPPGLDAFLQAPRSSLPHPVPSAKALDVWHVLLAVAPHMGLEGLLSCSWLCPAQEETFSNRRPVKRKMSPASRPQACAISLAEEQTRLGAVPSPSWQVWHQPWCIEALKWALHMGLQQLPCDWQLGMDIQLRFLMLWAAWLSRLLWGGGAGRARDRPKAEQREAL